MTHFIVHDEQIYFSRISDWREFCVEIIDHTYEQNRQWFCNHGFDQMTFNVGQLLRADNFEKQLVIVLGISDPELTVLFRLHSNMQVFSREPYIIPYGEQIFPHQFNINFG